MNTAILGYGSIAQARNAANMHVGTSFEPYERVRQQYYIDQGIGPFDSIHEGYGPQDAPDPVRQSRFIFGRGRPVWPAQRNSAYTWDPLPWSYWEMDQFRGTHFKVYFDATTHSQQVTGPRGPSWGLRANIADAAPISYGDVVGEYPSHPEGDDLYFPGGF